MLANHATVGVVSCRGGVCPGCTLLSVARTTYLLDKTGRVLHTWASRRDIFVAYLRPSGNLLRDGKDLELAPQFAAGGASGHLEEVTWHNEPLWAWSALPRFAYLSHHDICPLPNGNVLVLVWERKDRDEALAAGRHPELIPDGEVWNNLVVEVQPDLSRGRASEVRHWSQWEHLAQDHDPQKHNYVPDVAACPSKLDINYAPPGGKAACRNGGVEPGQHPSGHAVFSGVPGKTGERDWLHANSVDWTLGPDGRAYVLISYNVPSEVIVLAWSSSSQPGILFRFGNPLVARSGDRHARRLFCQHSAKWVTGAGGGALRFVLFNNGCAPHRMWSTADEFELNLSSGAVQHVWSFGPPAGHFGSFYAHHSSGVRRCPNGNTLITLGPQGIVFEVTPEGEEVWRFINPVEGRRGAPPAVVRQGAQRGVGKFGIFFAERYPPNHCAQLQGLAPGPCIEDFVPQY